MQTRAIGDLEVSVVGLGCNTFGGFGTPLDADDVEQVVHAALDAGITMFDTADVYGDGTSEELLGRFLGTRRDEVVIATKVGGRRSAGLTAMHSVTAPPVGADHASASTAPRDEPPVGASRRAIELGVEESLRRLGTDRIDLYQIHFPDPDAPIHETLDALQRLVDAGKVREIGCSNFTPEQLRAARDAATERGFRPFAAVQNEMSLLRPRPLDDVVPACDELGLGFIPYSPLTNGLLSGKYRRGQGAGRDTRLGNLPPELAERALSDRTFDRLERLDGFARDHGHSLLELSIAWLLSVGPVVSVIAGATRPDQVVANAAAGSWVIPSDVAQEALDLSR